MPTDEGKAMQLGDQSIQFSANADWPALPPEFVIVDGPLPPRVGGSLAQRLAELQPGQLAIWTERLAHAGVMADRVGTPRLSEQLSAALGRPIDQIICSALDTDPATCVQTATAAQFCEEVVGGVALLARLLKPQSASILIDAAVPPAWFESLRIAAAVADVRLIDLINPYPQSDLTLLLFSLANRRLRPGNLPTERGVLLFDAVAAYSMGQALRTDARVAHEPMVVRQHASERSKFVLAPTEITVGRLLDRVSMTGGGFVRGGDLLRDRRLPLETPLAGGERVLHVCPTEPPINPDPCTRCGWCVDVCPTRVHPATALQAAQEDDSELANSAGIAACIECGTCTYVCPSRLPLLKAIRLMKAVMPVSPRPR